MTVRLDWPPDVVERLTKEARQEGLSLDAYLLQTILKEKKNSFSDHPGRPQGAGAGGR